MAYKTVGVCKECRSSPVKLSGDGRCSQCREKERVEAARKKLGHWN